MFNTFTIFTMAKSLFFPKRQSMIGSVVLSIMAGVCPPSFAEKSQATLVTDPYVLESLGFASDTENVYMDIQQEGLSVIDNMDESGGFNISVTPTTGVDHSGISAKEFIGRTNPSATQWSYNVVNGLDMYRTGTERFADAQFVLPTGSTLTFFRWWAYDSNASNNLTFFVFEACQPGFGAGPITVTTIATASTTGATGDQSGVVTLSTPVDNRDCTYIARARFDAAGSNLRLQKVRLQFNR